MFDPNIKVRVVADFKYRDESYVIANSHLSFDIYDSLKIAELVNLYNPYYEYRDHLELPSVESLPFHVQEQVRDTYKIDKPADAQEYLPVSDKTSYEVGGDVYTPFGYSPYESVVDNEIKPLADNIVEVEVHEPKFLELDTPKPSIAEDKIETLFQSNNIEGEIKLVYSIQTTTMLSLNKDELEDKPANDIKKAILEINPDYNYTNKVEAIKYLLTLK